jgi:hypothetical protein
MTTPRAARVASSAGFAAHVHRIVVLDDRGAIPADVEAFLASITERGERAALQELASSLRDAHRELHPKRVGKGTTEPAVRPV